MDLEFNKIMPHESSVKTLRWSRLLQRMNRQLVPTRSMIGEEFMVLTISTLKKIPVNELSR